MKQRARLVLPVSLALVVLGALASGCSATFGNLCEQKCHSMKTAEPRDFDDCVRRCKK